MCAQGGAQTFGPGRLCDREPDRRHGGAQTPRLGGRPTAGRAQLPGRRRVRVRPRWLGDCGRLPEVHLRAGTDQTEARTEERNVCTRAGLYLRGEARASGRGEGHAPLAGGRGTRPWQG